jgi:hypothetical protein
MELGKEARPGFFRFSDIRKCSWERRHLAGSPGPAGSRRSQNHVLERHFAPGKELAEYRLIPFLPPDEMGPRRGISVVLECRDG